MRNLIQFLLRSSNFLIFLILEVVAFILICTCNEYHHSAVLSGANRIAAGTNNLKTSIEEYFNLRSENAILAEENARLKEKISKRAYPAVLAGLVLIAAYIQVNMVFGVEINIPDILLATLLIITTVFLVDYLTKIPEFCIVSVILVLVGAFIAWCCKEDVLLFIKSDKRIWIFGLMALVGIAVVPLFIIPTRSAGKTRWSITAESQECSDEINGILNETMSVSGQLLIKLLGDFIFKKESMGGGDIKLMFIFGLVLGPLNAISTIFIASFIALPISIIILKLKNSHEIPFGPFLSLGALILLFSGFNIIDLFVI